MGHFVIEVNKLLHRVNTAMHCTFALTNDDGECSIQGKPIAYALTCTTQALAPLLVVNHPGLHL